MIYNEYLKVAYSCHSPQTGDLTLLIQEDTLWNLLLRQMKVFKAECFLRPRDSFLFSSHLPVCHPSI